MMNDRQQQSWDRKCGNKENDAIIGRKAITKEMLHVPLEHLESNTGHTKHKTQLNVSDQNKVTVTASSNERHKQQNEITANEATNTSTESTSKPNNTIRNRGNESDAQTQTDISKHSQARFANAQINQPIMQGSHTADKH